MTTEEKMESLLKRLQTLDTVFALFISFLDKEEEFKKFMVEWEVKQKKLHEARELAKIEEEKEKDVKSND